MQDTLAKESCLTIPLGSLVGHSCGTLLLDTSGTTRNTSFYYQLFTQYFPTLLHPTQLPQITAQYHFDLKSLHEIPFSTTLYYKASTQSIAELL